MASDDLTLTNRLETLADYSGHGTQLVSLYIPPDRRVSDVRQRLHEEYADAENIKSKQTRQRVQQAITRAQNALRDYAAMPEQGLVVFSGVIEENGDETAVLDVFDDLPTPVDSYRYHCDDEFLVEPLFALTDTRSRVGLVVLDLQQAHIGWLLGAQIMTVDSLTSHVPGKHRAGGQSAPRFQRRRDEAIHEFLTNVGEQASAHFRAADDYDGVIIGGPSPTREWFVDGEYLHHELDDEVLGVVPLSDATEHGLERLADEADELLTDHAYTKQRERVDEFFTALRDDCAAYGRENVETALEYDAVDVLLVTPETKTPTLETRVEGQGGTLEVIQSGFDKGDRFAQMTDGYGAILRFPIE